jgi:hypothetical protein
MMSGFEWGAPQTLPSAPRRSRRREDCATFGAVVVAAVLLGAPAGLLWAAVSPRPTAEFVRVEGPSIKNVESTKAMVGADGSYLLVMLVMGLLCGALAWFLARRSGPWTVAALVVGGVLAALVAAAVGLRPGAAETLQALRTGQPGSPDIALYLGRLGEGGDLHLRAPWAAVAWPVGALVAFLVGALQRPEELD